MRGHASDYSRHNSVNVEGMKKIEPRSEGIRYHDASFND